MSGWRSPRDDCEKTAQLGVDRAGQSLPLSPWHLSLFKFVDRGIQISLTDLNYYAVLRVLSVVAGAFTVNLSVPRILYGR
jgi:hypothetical protein